MNDLYTVERTARYTGCDDSAALSLLEASNLLQDSLTEYCGALRLSNDILRDTCGLAWVIRRTRVQIYKPTYWHTRLTCRTYCVGRDRARLVIETDAVEACGTIAFSGIQEICAIDLTTRRLCHIDMTGYPKEIQPSPKAYPNSFEKLTGPFEAVAPIAEREVRWIDIDYSEHTNNASYVKFIMETFKSDFFRRKAITGMDIQYAAESREGDLLRVYRQEGTDCLEFLITRDSKKIVRARLHCAERT